MAIIVALRAQELTQEHASAHQAVIWSRLKHPNILPLIAIRENRKGRLPGFVAPYLSTQSLQEIGADPLDVHSIQHHENGMACWLDVMRGRVDLFIDVGRER